MSGEPLLGGTSGEWAVDAHDPERTRPIEAPPTPDPSWGDAFLANWRLNTDDEPEFQMSHMIDAYDDVEETLVRLGRPVERYRNPEWRMLPWDNVRNTPERMDQIWADVEEARAGDPRAFADLPATRAEFEQRARGRNGERRRDQQTAERGGVGTAIVPGLAYGLSTLGDFTKPENVLLLGAGGAGTRTLTGLMAREVATGAMGALIAAPRVSAAREALGERYSNSDLALDATIGGLIGGVVAGGLHVGGQAIDARRAMSTDASRGVAGETSDADLAGALMSAIAPEDRTPEVQAALNVLQREGEVDATNPFVGDAGLDAHAAALNEAMATLSDGGRVAARAHAPEPAAFLGADVHAAHDQFKQMVRSSESGGNDRAANARGSASGRYQFIESTFKTLYRRVFGASDGQAASAWANNRFDPAVQERLMDAAISEYETAFRRAGVPSTPGNLYLAHFLGPEGATRALRADPATSALAHFGAAVVNANPEVMRGKTVGDVIAWTRRRMNDPAGSVGAAAAPAMPSVAATPPIRPSAMDAVRPTVVTPDRTTLPTATIRAADIEVDAGLMQFKSGGDAQGVTDRLRGVAEWDPVSAGMITIWEANDGRRLVANGHQRVGLARRIMAGDPSQDISLNAIVLREADGFSARDARIATALANIAEGTGTVTDAAKVFREGGGMVEDALARRLPTTSPLIRDGRAIARLSDDAFGAVVNDVIPESHAAVIGQLAPDPATHMALVDLLHRLDPPNRRQAEGIVRQALAAGFHTEQQIGLFGAEDRVTALFAQRARVLDRALNEMRKLKGVFQTAANNADTLEGAGSKIAVEASSAEAAGNARALAIVERLAYSKGHVADLLNSAAERIANGEPIGTVVRDFVRDVRALDLEQLIRGADDGGPGGLSDPAGAPAGGSGRDGFAADEDGTLSEGLTPSEHDALEAAGQSGFGFFDPPEAKAFDDPAAGPGVARVGDSLWHDLTADDIAADTTLFDLGDGSEPRRIADISQEIETDMAAIDAVRRCM